VKKYDMKERMNVLEIVLAEKIIETRNNSRALNALTLAFEATKVEKAVAVEETKELSDYKTMKEREWANFQEKYDQSLREKRRIQNDLESTQEHLDTTTKRLKTERLEKENLQADYDSSSKKISNLNLKIENLLERAKELENQNEELTILSAEQRQKLDDGDDERRNLHETIQQLKGNIRVFARVRPLLSSELANSDSSEHIAFESDRGIVIEREEKKEKTEFEFDKIFQPNSTQTEVFFEVQQLIRSSLDGYNVCIFAYGQTGSGKTFSMEGPEDVDTNESMIGIIPRSFEFLIASIEKAKQKGWTYAIEASYLEVYCEDIRDLLEVSDKKLKVEGAGAKHVNVTNLSRHEVKSQQQILNLIKRAKKRRVTASTNCNERSSRSHSGNTWFRPGVSLSYGFFFRINLHLLICLCLNVMNKLRINFI
jgi:kinesin family protein C1